MAPARCPNHGRGHLVNAGAPNVVRCAAGGSCGMVMEPCRRHRGEPVAGGEPLSNGGVSATTYCPACTHTPHPGWRVRRTAFGSGYPVS